MSAPFRFKRFEVRQERAPMKVGTDGVLLGSWAEGGGRILDVGTGTGLIALMMAQRFEMAGVVGIDINEGAVADARENVARSEFRGRVSVERCALQGYEGVFDAVVCNPPFFVRSLRSPDVGRCEARHSDTLSICELVDGGWRLLCEGGVMSVILPYGQEGEFVRCACGRGFGVRRIMRVRSVENGDFKRVMIEVGRGYCGECVEEEMFVEVCRHVYSERYLELTRDFYLDTK